MQYIQYIPQYLQCIQHIRCIRYIQYIRYIHAYIHTYRPFLANRPSPDGDSIELWFKPWREGRYWAFVLEQQYRSYVTPDAARFPWTLMIQPASTCSVYGDFVTPEKETLIRLTGCEMNFYDPGFKTYDAYVFVEDVYQGKAHPSRGQVSMPIVVNVVRGSFSNNQRAP